MDKRQAHLYHFGPFSIDVTERTLLRDGKPVSLTPKVFDTLLVLVQEKGHLVEKNDLMNRLWPDTVVEESNLTQNIAVIRKVLGDRTNESRYIETVHKRS